MALCNFKGLATLLPTKGIMSSSKKFFSGRKILINHSVYRYNQEAGHKSFVKFKNVVKFNKPSKYWTKKKTCGIPQGKKCGGIKQSCPPRRACPPPGPHQTICCPSPHACCTSPCQTKSCHPNLCPPKC